MPVKLHLDLYKPEDASHPIPDEFKADVLRRFHNDEVGKLCRNDIFIQRIGSRHYSKIKRRKDKVTETRKAVMQRMRILARLLLKFRELPETKENTALELDTEEEIDAQQKPQQRPKTIKSGLKANVEHVLRDAIMKMTGIYHALKDDEKSDEMGKLLQVVTYYRDDVFGDAHYELSRKNNEKKRKPSEQPSNADVQKIKDYQVKKMAELVNDPYMIWDHTTFCELRDITASRLTMFNARRGGEPVRLLIFHVNEAMTDQWIDKERVSALTPSEKPHIKKLKITYTTAKGVGELVDVLFPEDVIKPLQILCDIDIRKLARILTKNQYVFPTKGSEDNHVSGWSALHNIAKLAGC
jgi:hypothetical protein